MLTATQLLAIASGMQPRKGGRRCFFCGGNCDESTPASEIVKDSFTARDTVAGARKIMARTHGASTRSTCRPITWWSVQDVFSWLAAKDLPAHPVYAMQGGGRWPRERIRVASLGGRRGSGIGRSEWEREYYGDVLRRLESGKGPTVGRK